MAKVTDRPITVLMVHAALVAFAYFELAQLSVQLSPDSDLPRLNVVTHYPGASSELVVQSVTLPIEEAASALDEVKDISSTSQQGVSTVRIKLQKNSNVDFVRLNLLEKLSVVAKQLPQGASFPVVAKYVPDNIRQLQGFMTYSLFGDRSLEEIQSFAEDHIKPRILSAKGVAAVRILGGAEKELYILVDRNKMHALGIPFQNVAKAVRESQHIQSGGEFVTGDVREPILAGSVIRNVDDLDSVMVEGKAEGRYVRLGVFGRVVDSISAPNTIVRINGKPSVTLEIDKEPGSNMLDVSSNVYSTVAKIEKRLPPDLHIEKISDRSVDIRREVHELASKALYAGVLIFVVVFFFLFEKKYLPGNFLRSVTMVISVIFSIGVGIIFLAISGIGLNIVTLAALALSLGIAIDNNVVISESIYREFEQKSESVDLGDLIAIAEKQVRLPLGAATLTTVGALLPVFFLPPELKQFFIPFAETTGVVVFSSLIVAFTFLPVSILFTLRRRGHASPPVGEPKTLKVLKEVYVSTVEWLINHKAISVITAMWLVGFPIWLLPGKIGSLAPASWGTGAHRKMARVSFVEEIESYTERASRQVIGCLIDAYNSTFGSDSYQSIKPYLDYGLGGSTQLFFRHVYKGELWSYGSETSLVVSIYAPQGTPIEKINRFAGQIEELPNMRWVKRMTTRVTPVYASVRIDFADSVASTVIPFILKERLTSLAAQAGGFTVSVSGFGPGFYSGGESPSNFTIAVTGYNYRTVREIAEGVEAKIARNPRVDNVQIDRLPWESESYEVVGEIKRGYLNSLGLSVNDFLDRFSPSISSSLQRSSILIDNRPIDLVIKFNDYSSRSTGNLPAQVIDVGDDRIMSVGSAVDFRKTPVMPVIERDNQQYIRYITFDFDGPFRFGDRFADETTRSTSVPPGYEVRRLNNLFTYATGQTVSLILLSVLAVLIVFMVTASLYESYRKPFIVILSVPMSLIGLFTVFFIANANFGQGGYASVLFLIGLSVNNGILLVDRISCAAREKQTGDGQGHNSFANDMNPDSRRTPEMERARLTARAASERLRPILMTTLVTIAGFAPFVINADIYSFWYSFSLGIIGGVFVSSLMILLFMPVFYDLVAGKRDVVEKSSIP